MIRFEIFSITSCGIRAQSAVMASSDVTALTTIGYAYVRASNVWPTPFKFYPSIVFSSVMTLVLLSSSLTMVVRGRVEPSALVPVLREAVRSLDPQLPLKFRTLDQVFSSSLDQRRFSLVIFGVFGAVALLLAAMGIYGVTTYAVAQRTQEIGIRMALGAQMSDVLKLVLRNGMSLTFIGAAIGLGGAYAITRVMRSLLFEVVPTDFATFITVSVVLIVVALLACYLPARRATKVDPLVALRYE